MKVGFSPVTLSDVAMALFVSSVAPAQVSGGPSAQNAGSAMAAGGSRGPVSDLGRVSEGFAPDFVDPRRWGLPELTRRRAIITTDGGIDILTNPVPGWFARGIRLPAIGEALDDVFGAEVFGGSLRSIADFRRPQPYFGWPQASDGFDLVPVPAREHSMARMYERMDVAGGLP